VSKQAAAVPLDFTPLNTPIPQEKVIAEIRSMLKKYWFYVIFFIGIILLSLLLLMIFYFIGLIRADGSEAEIGKSFGVFLATAAFFALGGAIVALVTWHKVTQLLKLDAFAKANNFTYEKERDTSGLTGLLFTTGYDRSFANVVSGVHNGKHFIFGESKYTTGSGKNRQEHTKGVICVKLKRRLPHTLLDAKSNNSFGFTNLPQTFSRKQRLQLEGDFNNYFDLYIPEGYGRDALYYLTPELMQVLVDYGSGYDIEVVDDQLYIYSSKEYAYNEKEIRELFNLVDLIGGEVHENTEMYADERVGQRAANVVALPGQRLKKGVSWLGIFIIAYIILKLIIDFWLPFAFGD
jgi:hypothetical protein